MLAYTYRDDANTLFDNCLPGEVNNHFKLALKDLLLNAFEKAAYENKKEKAQTVHFSKRGISIAKGISKRLPNATSKT